MDKKKQRLEEIGDELESLKKDLHQKKIGPFEYMNKVKPLLAEIKTLSDDKKLLLGVDFIEKTIAAGSKLQGAAASIISRMR